MTDIPALVRILSARQVDYRRGLNFTLITDLGDLDLLGEVSGGGLFEDLLPDTQLVSLEGCAVRRLAGAFDCDEASGRETPRP